MMPAIWKEDFNMTKKQYQCEVAQNMVNQYSHSTDEAEQHALGKMFIAATLGTDEFWTEERLADYEKYKDAPDGSVCPKYPEIQRRRPIGPHDLI